MTYTPVSPGESLLPNAIRELVERDEVVQTEDVPWLLRRDAGAATAFGALGGRIGGGIIGDQQDAYGAPANAPTIATPRLDLWSVEARAYKVDVAGKISILARLFGGETDRVAAGVVHEAKRYTRQRNECVAEIGVAVRLAAATSQWKTTAQLTLPAMAADAELNATDARVTIEVLGYSGPLGTILPAADQLNITTIATYLEAFQELQAQVFGDAGLPYLSPTLLAYDLDPPTGVLNPSTEGT